MQVLYQINEDEYLDIINLLENGVKFPEKAPKICELILEKLLAEEEISPCDAS